MESQLRLSKDAVMKPPSGGAGRLWGVVFFGSMPDAYLL